MRKPHLIPRGAVVALGAAALFGCAPVDEPPPAETSTEPTTPQQTTSPPTGTTAPPTETTNEPLAEYDCATMPLEATGFREVPGASGYHDVAFDPDGLILGTSGAFSVNLMWADYDGNSGIFVPNTGTLQQMAWLPDGDLAVASDTHGIQRVDAYGATSPINGNIRPYGLILGPDDMLYAADQNKVHRVDPDTGAAEVLVGAGALTDGSPRVLNFSLDYSRLFMGTFLGSNGRIYAVDLDDNLDPIGQPYVFTSGVGSGSYHDGLGIDICGYLYVPDYSTSALYRIDPTTGSVQTLLQESGLFSSAYGHGLQWGTGEHGWDDHALYLPQPYNGNTVMEVVIGVPSRFWNGVGINLP